MATSHSIEIATRGLLSDLFFKIFFTKKSNINSSLQLFLFFYYILALVTKFYCGINITSSFNTKKESLKLITKGKVAMKHLCKKNIFFLSFFSICSVYAVEQTKTNDSSSVLKKRTHIQSSKKRRLNSSLETNLFLFEKKKDEKGIESTVFADIANNNANNSSLNTTKEGLIRISEKDYVFKKKTVIQAESILVVKTGSNGNSTYTVCQTGDCHFDYENLAETEYYAMVEVNGHPIITNPDVAHIEFCDQRTSHTKYAEDQAINSLSGVANSEKKEKSECHSLVLIPENDFDLFEKPPSPKIRKRRAKKNTNECSKANDELKVAMFENKEFKDYESNNELFEHTQ